MMEPSQRRRKQAAALLAVVGQLLVAAGPFWLAYQAATSRVCFVTGSVAFCPEAWTAWTLTLAVFVSLAGAALVGLAVWHLALGSNRAAP